MAITVTQTPTTPNVAYTNLLYVVTSDNIGSVFQHKFVVDIYKTLDGSSEFITRMFQAPNANGHGVFDVSRILSDHIYYDVDWKISDKKECSLSVRDFEIKFGEQYATTETGVVAVYDGADVVGDPIVQEDIQVFNGIVDPMETGQYDWIPETILSSKPSGTTFGTEDYSVMTFYGGDSGVNINVRFEDINDSAVANNTYSIGPGQFMNVPVGPKNVNASDDWAYVEVRVDGSIERIYYKDQPRGYERVNLAFVNEYGHWDTFGTYLPKRATTSIEREIAEQVPVYYQADGTINYNPISRGEKQYSVKAQKKYTVHTNWLNVEQSEWLEQLFVSPHVFVQYNDNFYPIIIENSSVTHNTGAANQKTFGYDIEYRFANRKKTQ